MTVVLFALGNLVVIVVLVVYVNRRIDKRLRPDQIMSQMRSEVEGIITELNQTTERNIALIEDRVHRLQSLMDAADRRITVLKRETEREDRTKAVYTSLGRKASIQRAQGGAPGDEVGASPFPSAGKDSASAEHEEGSKKGSNTETNSYSAGNSAGAEARKSEAKERSGASDNAAAEDGDHQSAEAPDERGFPTASRRNQILELHRKGIAANIIANRVGTTIGEVELVISLDSR